MNSATRQENEQFEDEVRRIARQLWASAQFSGSTVADGRERDGVFETEECLHLLEATTSRRKDKAQEDIRKLVGLATRLQRQRRTVTKAVRCWFVTRDEPTADQRKVAEKHCPLLTCLSFSQFQALLIDSRAYLTARDDYNFGSVRDPLTGAKDPAVDFVEVSLSNPDTGQLITPTELAKALEEEARYVILGDFGSGKSMTLRYVYRELRKAHLKGATPRFPVFINLRDHFGQNDPSELIERHARNIGFPNPWHLVRAWRAGYVHLLLDGFDEITTLNIQGLWKRLRDNRFRAMEAVRRMIREHPPAAGLAIAGRAHFFDSPKECRDALGLSAKFKELSLNEFSDEQIDEYLRKSGLSGTVPPWLPSRPLLVAYLASKGLLSGVLAGEPASDSGPEAGWDILLENIAAREAEIEAGIDGPTVQRILERLATKARATFSGLGPLTPETVIGAFREVCGYNPDERGMVLLQRLPGLGIDRADEGTRMFLDEEFVDTCRAGDLVYYSDRPYDFEPETISTIECATGSLGIAVATRRATTQQFSSRKLNAAIRRAREVSPGYLTADIARVTIECGYQIEEPVYIRDIYIPELEFSKSIGNAGNLEFHECFFSWIGIDLDVNTNWLPRFKSCFIDEIDGRLSVRDLPEGAFDESCIIESFSTAAPTTDAVLSLQLPLATLVALTILKKLYERRGRGRRENALFRGLDHHARRLVPAVLSLIQSEGLAISHRRGGNVIWLPDRSKMRRVGRIISAPTSRQDPLIQATANLE